VEPIRYVGHRQFVNSPQNEYLAAPRWQVIDDRLKKPQFISSEHN